MGLTSEEVRRSRRIRHLAQSEGVRSFANRSAFEIAEAHGVLITELTNTRLARRSEVTQARRELIQRMVDNVRYRDVRPRNARLSHREFLLSREVNGDGHLWDTISVKDVATILNCDHSNVVVALRIAARSEEEVSDAQ